MHRIVINEINNGLPIENTLSILDQARINNCHYHDLINGIDEDKKQDIYMELLCNTIYADMLDDFAVPVDLSRYERFCIFECLMWLDNKKYIHHVVDHEVLTIKQIEELVNTWFQNGDSFDEESFKYLCEYLDRLDLLDLI